MFWKCFSDEIFNIIIYYLQQYTTSVTVKYYLWGKEDKYIISRCYGSTKYLEENILIISLYNSYSK